MLIRFVVSNFMSFKDETEFNMLTGKSYKSHPNHVKQAESKVNVIKSAAIYGANGSGKSNLVAAISFLRELLVEEVSEETPLMPLRKRFKMDDSYKDKPTTFRIEYESEDIHYDYGIELYKGRIEDEWLYKIDSIKSANGILVFRRKYSFPIELGIQLTEEDLSFTKGYEKKILKENEPFLSKVSEILDNYELLSKAIKWFKKLKVTDPYGELLTIPIISSEEKVRLFSTQLLKESKTGINTLQAKEVPFEIFFSYKEEDQRKDIEESLYAIFEKEKDVVKKDAYNIGQIFVKDDKINFATLVNNKPVVIVLNSIHSGNIEFELDEESDGTNRLLELTPMFYDLLNNDRVVIIDEIERSMHPILAMQLIKLFFEKSDTKSQLIFTTHESNLLNQELFRQDEIWFVEKKEDGSSEFYPLSDFSERYDKDIRKGYLQGRYGAIPFMSNLSDLNWD